ncbi:MAG: hypothetical protein ACI9LV_000263 [Candidatus Nanohaloarchaea archaeon]|jgi:hypothetical protein
MFRMKQKDFDFHNKEVKAVKFKGGVKHGFIKSMICKALDDASTDTVIEVETHCSPGDRKKKLEDFGSSVQEMYIIDPTNWPDNYQEAYDRANQSSVPEYI